MSISTDENVIMTNNEPIDSLKNKASYKHIKSYYAGLRSLTKSSCNILRKIDNNEKEKSPQNENYDSEISSKNEVRRKSQFDIFKANLGQNYTNTNNSNRSKIQKHKNSIRERSNENILNTKSSIQSNFNNYLESNNKNTISDNKKKFSEFQTRKSHKRNSKYKPNDEKRNILV